MKSELAQRPWPSFNLVHSEFAERNIKTDFTRLMQIVRRSGYRGYFPLETPGQGDPYQKVRELYHQVSNLLT